MALAPDPRSKATHSDSQKAARVKALLSNYYGDTGDAEPDSLASMQQQQRPQQRGPDPAASAALTDLDSNEFNVDRYLATLLRDARLEKLLASSTTMSSDIKSLDADMQRLVYENYNRFITATDTIRELKTNIDAASPSMMQLHDTSEEIERCREAVKAKLQRRQAQVTDLNEVQALLAKLEAVFQLPQRLRVAINAKAYALAVDNYISARPVLKRAGYKGTLRRVAAEVEVQVKELTALLKERVMAQSDDAVECIGLIRRLGGPVADLQDEFLRAMKASVRAALSTASAALDQPKTLGSREAADKALAALQQQFFPELVRNTQLFTELFERNAKPALIRVCREVLSDFQSIVKKVLASAALTSSQAAAAAAVRDEHEAATPTAEEADWGTGCIVEALEHIVADLARLQSLLPELNLLDKSAEISEKCIRHHIHACVLALRDALWHIMSDAPEDTRPVALQQRASLALANGASSLLRALREYGEHPSAAASWQEALVELLQGSLQRLLVALVQLFLSVCSIDLQDLGLTGIIEPFHGMGPGTPQSQPNAQPSSQQEEPASPFVLFLASFCLHLRDTTVPHMTGLLESTFLSQQASAPGMWFDAALLTRMLDLAFKHLLDRYLELHSSVMVDAVRAGISAQQRGNAEPKRARPFCNAWVDVLAAARAEVAALQEEVQQASGRRGGYDAVDISLGLSGSMAQQTESPFTITAVFPGIIDPALDAFVELLRLQTLGRAGLHQVQLDVHAIRQMLSRYLASYAAPHTYDLLNKLVVTAAERASDPSLLTPAVIESLLQA